MSAPTSRRSARTRARRPVAVDTVVLGAAVLVALAPLVPVYGLRSLAPAAIGGVVLGAGVSAVGARRRWNGGLTAGALLVLALLVGPALAMPLVAGAGIVPNVDTVTGLLGGVVSVWKEVLTLDPELGAAADVLVAPFALGLLAAASATAIATRAERRAGAWAALIPVGVLGIAVLLGTVTTVAPGPVGVALAVLLLPWVAWHRGTLAPRRAIALAVVVVCVVGAGVVGGPVLVGDHDRTVVRDDLVPPFDPREHPSPLSQFRAFIKDYRDTDLLTVRGLPEGARVRLATMDAFDGVVWNVAGSEQAEGSGSFRRVGQTIEPTVTGPHAHVEFEAHGLPLLWLPTVGYAEQFRFSGADAVGLASELRYNDATGTAVLVDGIPDGARWSVDAVVPPQPEDADLEHAAAAQVRLPEPVGAPDASMTYGSAAASSASSPALMAQSLEASLAERGYFSHGVADDEEASLSGHGADRITTLLTGDLMVGDGEQYASAMALMARQLGLPARVVLGFVPDESEDGADEIVVTGDDIQAWVEVDFAGYGWVAYDPTPDESRTPRPDEQPQPTAQEPSVRQPPLPLQDPVDPPDRDTEQPQTRDGSDDEAAARDWTPVVVAAVATGVPLLLLLVPLVVVAVLRHRRRRRRRTAPDPIVRVVGGWQEVLDEARDLRRSAPRTATRRETAVHLAGAFPRPTSGRATAAPAVGGTVAGLAASADAVVFGPDEPPTTQVDLYWQQVEAARRAMRAAVPRRHRLRYRYSTASLRAGRRSRRGRR